MPTYQYACTECDHTLEQVQSFSEDSLTVCPACEGRLRKVFNAVGVVFKGSGFYRNDSREKTKTPDSGSSGGSEKNGESASSGASSDTSSDAASSSKPDSAATPKKTSDSAGSSTSTTKKSTSTSS